MEKIQIAWSGDQVTGPGLSTFYFDEAWGGNKVTALATFFNDIKAFFPTGITWTIPGDGDLINDATGELAGTWTESGATTVTSTAAGNHAQGVGARVVWRTATIRGGRRVRGSTFLVPLVVNAYDSQGTISSAAMTTLTAAVDAFVTTTAGGLVIWSRPRPALAGDAVPVTSGSVPDAVSWLRSRRT